MSTSSHSAMTTVFLVLEHRDGQHSRACGAYVDKDLADREAARLVTTIPEGERRIPGVCFSVEPQPLHGPACGHRGCEGEIAAICCSLCRDY